MGMDDKRRRVFVYNVSRGDVSKSGWMLDPAAVRLRY